MWPCIVNIASLKYNMLSDDASAYEIYVNLKGANNY